MDSSFRRSTCGGERGTKRDVLLAEMAAVVAAMPSPTRRRSSTSATCSRPRPAVFAAWVDGRVPRSLTATRAARGMG